MTDDLSVYGNIDFTGDLLVNGKGRFTKPQIFEDSVTFKVDGLKPFEIKNFTLNTFLKIGIAQSNASYHRAAKTGDIVIARLGQQGDNRKLIISTGSDAFDIPAQAVGITGANDTEATGVWAHNNLNVRIGPYSQIAPDHRLEVLGNSYFNGNVGIGVAPTTNCKLQVSGNSYFDGDADFTGHANFQQFSIFDKIGIKTKPSQELHVRGTTFLDGNLGVGIANPTQKLHVDGATYLNGNVGIGTTPSGSDPYGFKLSVYGMACFSTDLGGEVLFTHHEHIVPGSQNHANAIYSYENNRLFLGISDKRINTLYTYTVNYHTLTSASDIRLKENIRPLPPMLEKLQAVQSYNYNYTDEYFKDFSEEEKEYMQRLEYGFLAQEIQEIFPELVFESDSTGMLAINYVSMIPILTAALNEQQQVLEDQQNVMEDYTDLINILQDNNYAQLQLINELRQNDEHQTLLINELQNEVEYLKNLLFAHLAETDPITNPDNENNPLLQLNLSQIANDRVEEMIIYQNAPNPFNENTFVRCYIPKSVNKVQLCVYNMQGVQIKCLDVAERGNIEVKIEAGALTSGIYTYLLIGDEKTSDAKNMILTK
jgi:hypothetical protein